MAQDENTAISNVGATLHAQVSKNADPEETSGQSRPCRNRQKPSFYVRHPPAERSAKRKHADEEEEEEADAIAANVFSTPNKVKRTAEEDLSWQQFLLNSPLSEANMSDVDFDDDEEETTKTKRKRKLNLKLKYMLPIDPSAPSVPEKTFLKSGLYASELKYSESQNRARRAFQKKLAAEENEEEEETPRRVASYFQMPQHYGHYLLTTARDFKLPFDIFFENEHALLRPVKEPEPYTKIKSNIYVHRNRKHDALHPICECVLEEGETVGCGENCWNRCMYVECHPQHCPVGKACSNQPIQRRETIQKDLQVFYAGSRGFGLRATIPVKKGQFIMEYRGEVISPDECAHRMETVYKDRKNYYFLGYSDGEVLDAGLKGSEVRFVNHSCDPNCHIQKWTIDGEYAIGLFASRDIPAFEELVYDYNFEWYNAEQQQECFCGSSKCRGFISRRNAAEDRDKERQLRRETVQTAQKGKKQKGRKKKEESSEEEWVPLAKCRKLYAADQLYRNRKRAKQFRNFLPRNTTWCLKGHLFPKNTFHASKSLRRVIKEAKRRK